MICRKFGKLTDDHVVPKCCDGDQAVELRNIVGVLEGGKPRISQSGMRLRTLCETCNNYVLGKQYDPFLGEFGARVRIATSESPWPRYVMGNPGRIGRAVAGHILAAYLPEDIAESPLPQAPMFDAIRRFVLEPEQPTPEGIDIYWWPYQADRRAVITCAGHVSFWGNRPPVIGAFLKFPPLAFWLIWKKPSGLRPYGKRLPMSKRRNPDQEQRIPMARGLQVPPSGWPEEPGDRDAMLVNDEATVFGDPRG